MDSVTTVVAVDYALEAPGTSGSGGWSDTSSGIASWASADRIGSWRG